jgi:hypothetical protein
MTAGLKVFDGCGDADRSVYTPGGTVWVNLAFVSEIVGPYGGKGFQVFGSGGHAIYALPFTSDHVMVGFHAYRQESNNPETGPTFELREGSNVHVQVRFTHQGDVEVLGPTGALLGSCFPGSTGLPPQETGLFKFRRWHYVEIEAVIHATLGEVRVYLWGDPTPYLELLGVNTKNALGSVVDRLRWSGPNGNAIRVDDLYVEDMSVGGADRLGIALVVKRDPNADVDSEWVPSPAPGAPHFAQVDEQPFSASDFLSTGLDGAVDRFRVTDGLTGATPRGVRLLGQLALIGNEAASARLTLQDGSSGELAAGPTVILATTPVVQRDLYADRPAGAGEWTTASVNAMRIGVEKMVPV